MQTLITIGTDDGSWAPPKPVELTVTLDGRTGLAITNRDAVGWSVEGRGLVIAAAIRVGTGEWMRVDLTGGQRVDRGQEAVLAARALMIDVSLPTMSSPNMEQHQLRSRRQLGRRLRILPKASDT
jgi:hypothetical protein